MRQRGWRMWIAAATLSLGGELVDAQSTAKLAAPGWTRDDAAHLLRRAAFGGTPEQIDRFHALGRQGAVSELVDYEKVKAAFEPPSVMPYEPPPFYKEGPLAPEERQEVIRIRRQNHIIEFSNMSEWWLRRMISTPRPLEEKLTLFWHGHFTSGMREVENPRFLYDQNQLFRRLAKGSFGELVKAISADPAMLRYLDNVSNVAGHPNENYARELLELFTMGEGNYSENDIKAVARAFTGWTINRATGTPFFEMQKHDFGFKALFGQFRRFNGYDVVDLILAQPATAKHVAHELWVYFAGTEPDPAVLTYLASTFQRSNFSIEALLRAMFMHDAFYAPAVKFAAVKSPAELVVGTYRLLELPPSNAASLATALRRMGQELFQPPNVKGWDGGLKWINTSTLLERYNFVVGALYGNEAPREGEQMAMRMQQMMSDMPPEMASELKLATRDPNVDQPPFDPAPLLRKYKLDTAEKIVDHFASRLLQQPLPERMRRTLLDRLKSQVGDSPNWDSESATTAIRGLIHLIVSTPEYQVE
ncbi:MAG: DUF1800 domain-containing protein [Phycisphaerales bacterium]|nr:DUF1800 domain-containing protein [Phycisphaerales bacterium]